jgi:hypothetical protein
VHHNLRPPKKCGIVSLVFFHITGRLTIFSRAYTGEFDSECLFYLGNRLVQTNEFTLARCAFLEDWMHWNFRLLANDPRGHTLFPRHRSGVFLCDQPTAVPSKVAGE